MAAENSMMLAEKTDELLNRGRSQGYLSTEEVSGLVQEGELSAAEVEEFYAALEEEEITLVSSEVAEAAKNGGKSAAAAQLAEAPAAQIAHALTGCAASRASVSDGPCPPSPTRARSPSSTPSRSRRSRSRPPRSSRR